ncbi:peptidase [Alkalihalobacillus trypoxylicola]|uniref:Acetylornithine deacetylase n=1 Tax=Alkalihalobacillus trypoxylicola TaxID=519424 RepID=A0A162F4P4_9BACI|nr:peptidase [Alkalihalobacillus trypoxylicola]KYG34798.1 acetylornithine deacetylase [Alkalihalobacillus trypoxylicola]
MDTSFITALKKALEKRRAEYTEKLKKLIQVPTTFLNEQHGQRLIEKYISDIGLEVNSFIPNIKVLKKHPSYMSNRDTFENSPIIIGEWKGSGGGNSIILNSHIDVVPTGERNQWYDDPFSGVFQDGFIYGRGATDMKGGTISLLLALQLLSDIQVTLKGDVIFQSVVDEECGGAGTLATILEGYKADGVLIPEPTNQKIFPLQQGSIWFRLKLRGRSAHGGTRYEGVSAIEKAMQVIQQIRQIEMRRNQRINDPLYQNLPIPIPINVGKISGGDWPSSVPDYLEIEGRLGVSPEETIEEAKEEFSYLLSPALLQDPWFEQYPIDIEWFGASWLPGKIEQTHPFMKALVDSFESLYHKKPRIEASPWGTDAGLFSQVAHIPAIVMGPGITELAHFPNEKIKLENVFESAILYAIFLTNWCKLDSD